jgi:hypothetical protein
MKDIFFSNLRGHNDLYPPEPASKLIPEWYKNTDSYANIGGINKLDPKNETNATIKKCMPVFDAVSSGYILKTPMDLLVQQEIDENGNKYPYYRWPTSPGLEFHPKEQAKNYFLHKDSQAPVPKFMNDWLIVTPKGYSCLFISPIHHDIPFVTLSGVVDTDSYKSLINFPFMLKDLSFEGLIPAGTPMIQIIPFKRDNWKMNISDDPKFIKYHEKDGYTLRTTFYNNYKNNFRQSKTYK